MSHNPHSELRFFEAWKDEAGHVQTRHDVFFQDDFENWLDLKANYRITLPNGTALTPEQLILRLVCCDNPGQDFALRCSQTVFERLCKDFRLHGTTEEAFLNNNGAYARYFSKDDISGDVESLSLVIKIPRWIKGREAISVSYDGKVGTTRAFLHWISEKEHKKLVKFLLEMDDKSAYTHPLLLPTYLLQHHRKLAEEYRAEIDRSIVKIELQLGYAVPGLLYYKPSIFPVRTPPNDGYHLEEVVRRLHALATELGGLLFEANFGKEVGGFLRKTELKLGEHSVLASIKSHTPVSDILIDQVKFATNLYSTMGAQMEMLKQRVHNQINLTFSLIAQEENKLARAVAENSKRDSSAMKTIAVVTMFFLPPTFVATLFSMSMFNWTSEKEGVGLTSSFFWVYWVVAIPLTFLVLLVWRIWWKFEERQYHNGLRKTKQG